MISGGKAHTLQVGRAKIFVKRIPVTALEFANPFSTQNLYDLTMFYNYGAGSVGLGVFREWVPQIKTTNWVLEGATEHFPLIYYLNPEDVFRRFPHIFRLNLRVICLDEAHAQFVGDGVRGETFAGADRTGGSPCVPRKGQSRSGQNLRTTRGGSGFWSAGF